MKKSILISICSLWCLHLSAQDVELYNPSFEGLAHAGGQGFFNIPGWVDCGFKGETPPDLHDGRFQEFFGVSHQPSDGRTYLGMVARENETWESVSQRLYQPITNELCYEFSIDLCRSMDYNSPVEPNGESLPFTRPVVLRIYGSDTPCGRDELLAESPKIMNTQWQTYDFKFEPKFSHRYLILEAFYKVPILDPYNGNVLIDRATMISVVACDDEVLAAVEPSTRDVEPTITVNPGVKTNPSKSQPKKNDHKPVRDEIITENPAKSIDEFVQGKVTKDQIIEIKDLGFEVDQSRIKRSSFKSLDRLYAFLIDNPELIIEIRGHTNGLCTESFCNKLSKDRAMAVRKYLMVKGIPKYRMLARGYGKTEAIASNDNQEGRAKNQRVEIKIIRVN